MNYPVNEKIRDERYNFDVMLKDQVVASVRLSEGHFKIMINSDIPLGLQVFAMPNPNDIHVYTFLKSRCYEDGRADLKEILKEVGMERNNPFEWCKKTHGVVLGDYYWIRLENEELEWKDVKYE